MLWTLCKEIISCPCPSKTNYINLCKFGYGPRFSVTPIFRRYSANSTHTDIIPSAIASTYNVTSHPTSLTIHVKISFIHSCPMFPRWSFCTLKCVSQKPVPVALEHHEIRHNNRQRRCVIIAHSIANAMDNDSMLLLYG